MRVITIVIRIIIIFIRIIIIFFSEFLSFISLEITYKHVRKSVLTHRNHNFQERPIRPLATCYRSWQAIRVPTMVRT